MVETGEVTAARLQPIFMLFLNVFMPGKFLGVHKSRKLHCL